MLISDLQREKSELYPLEIYEIINDLKKLSIEQVIASYDLESQKFVKEYIEVLLEKE